MRDRKVICAYPGCRDYPRTSRKRCYKHSHWKLWAEERGLRPPKPAKGYQWCEPCKAWFHQEYELIHVPASASVSVPVASGERMSLTLEGLT